MLAVPRCHGLGAEFDGADVGAMGVSHGLTAATANIPILFTPELVLYTHLERETGFEPATSSMGSLHSTN